MTSTDDAARKGRDLGQRGIPLGDTFKNSPSAVREAAEAAHKAAEAARIAAAKNN